MTKHRAHTLSIILLFLLPLLLPSCGPGGDTFRIKGHFRDMQAGQLYIYNESDDHARLDTLNIQEGRFLYKGQTSEVTPYILVFPNGMEQVIFAGPNQDLQYEATANDMKNYVVNGSEENKLMNQFRQETYTMNPTATRGVARTYITDHPTSPVAIYLLHNYFVQDPDASPDELTALLKTLKPHHPHNHYLLDIEKKNTAAQSRQPRQTIPNLTLISRNLTPTRLWAQESDYTLLAFWALWHPQGYDTLWRLRHLSDKHRTSGQLRILAISLDLERHRWEDTTLQDSLSTHIHHYCDGRGFESPLVKTLGIDQLPLYILADRNHQVIDTGTDINNLDDMLKKHLPTPTP